MVILSESNAHCGITHVIATKVVQDPRWHRESAVLSDTGLRKYFLELDDNIVDLK